MPENIPDISKLMVPPPAINFPGAPVQVETAPSGPLFAGPYGAQPNTGGGG